MPIVREAIANISSRLIGLELMMSKERGMKHNKIYNHKRLEGRFKEKFLSFFINRNANKNTKLMKENRPIIGL